METRRSHNQDEGFVLPAILVVVGALMILAVGGLILAGMERSTARISVDQQRADLAVHAGLADVSALLRDHTGNDDFLVLQGSETLVDSKRDPLPYLYIARGSSGGSTVSYHYIPLFSTASLPLEGALGSALEPPLASALVGGVPQEMTTLPWCNPVKTAWIELKDADDKIVSRYAYWVEDLQGKLDAKIAGNAIAARPAFPDSGSKPLTANGLAAEAIALHALNPVPIDTSPGDLAARVVAGRPMMISPESVLGAAGISAPQPRDPATGRLTDLLAAALEMSTTAGLSPYHEQSLVAHAPGISAVVAGKPRMNLNDLLEIPRAAAVDKFAAWLTDALPNFTSRQGGFPDDYAKTLAANALDYADADSSPTVGGFYRGLDGAPQLSELAVKIEYLGHESEGGRLLLRWHLQVFAEFWNMTSRPISGKARVSYEVALNHTPIGSGTAGKNFDDPALLTNPARSHHDLTRIGERFFGPEIEVTLAPDEYRFFRGCDVECSIDVSPNNVSYNTVFYLEESPGASGMSVLWNGVETERVAKIIRDLGPPNAKEMRFNILTPKAVGKAAVPSGSYGPYGEFTNNMGDPRMSHYFRTIPLAENSWKNLSPNRRNVRLSSIYNSDGPEKRTHYGRVLPSEWPDGGHNAAIGTFFVPPANQSLATDVTVLPTDARYLNPPPTIAARAPQRISNAGRFFSPVELGNVYDPVMWTPAYVDLPDQPGSGARDTATLHMPPPGKSSMPATRNGWPEVTTASTPSGDFGGGNTLRIGRPEHQRFARPGTHAAHLLDLFFAGNPHEPTVLISGHVNVNTAGKDTLRAMAAGLLAQDPELRKVTDWAHETANGNLSPAAAKLALGAPTRDRTADRIAEAILHSRPFASMKDLACATNEHGDAVFGNPSMYPEGNALQWSDAAAEEIFARVHDSATLRSRNFRVWVVGQAVNQLGAKLEVLAEARRAFTVFADPGQRNPDGSIRPPNPQIGVLHETDF